MFASPPQGLTPAVIQHSIGRMRAEQGEILAQRGAVSLEGFESLNASDLDVKARVQDEQPRPFHVQIYYRPADDWVLSGDCTCSIGTDCRHCAAVAFAWLAQKPQPVASQTELAAWLEALRTAETGPQAPSATTGEQIVYLLSTAEWESGALQVQASVRDGTRGGRKPRQLFPSELHEHPASVPEDREIAVLLQKLEPGVLSWKGSGSPFRYKAAGHSRKRTPKLKESSVVVLRGSVGAMLLELLLATGRSLWSDKGSALKRSSVSEQSSTGAVKRDDRGKSGRQPLTAGGLRRIKLAWESVPGGQKLKSQLEPPAAGMLQLGSKVIYYDPESSEIGMVDLKPEKLLLLQQSPVIPPTAIEQVSRSLLEILPAPPLPRGSSLKEELIAGIRPVPVLILQGETNTETEAIPDHAAGGQLARLAFDYAGHRLGTDFQPESSLLRGETVYRIQRDEAAEQTARRQVLQTGLLPIEGRPDCFGFAHDGEAHSLASLAGPYLRNWHHWLHDSLSHLRASGWHVDFEPSFRLAFLSSPAWQAELKPHALEHKWFDLALGIEINGERVELLPLLLRMLKLVPDPRAMREQLEHHDTWLLPLDPHPLTTLAARSQHRDLPQRWLEVPARRLARVLDILIEIYDYLPTSQEPDTLRLSAFSALQLKTQLHTNPDDYGVHWQAPPELEAAAARLAGRPQDGMVEIAPPPGLTAELRPYQQRGLNWLQTLRELGLNGILADDMGLGKTVQTLAHLLLEKDAGRLDTPALVVAPTSVLINWQREAERFTPGLRCLLLHGPERESNPAAIANADLILTSYTLMRQDASLHGRIQYSWLVLDEAQQIKNPRSRTAKMACAQPARHRLCLSGTPVENQLEELWSLFHFLMPGFLDTLERFNSRFRHPIERTGDIHRQAALRERIRPLMLRRRKLDVERELPPKIEILRTVELGTAQRDLYETMRLAVDHQVSRIVSEKGFKRSRIVILDALLKLRQICCDPRLLNLPEAQKLKHSAKLELLMELLPELLAEGRRILIFSQFVKMLALIEARLQEAGQDYALLTGATRRRQVEIDKFQAGEVPLFLISLKAGGLGLNLTAADTVIHYDPWWNPASEQQATDRAWRIGQVQPVFVYKLIVAGTLEESILTLQQSKRALQEGLFEADPFTGLRPEALLAMLKTGNS
ncbi:MAG TPA: DEAD/DEAH box helicase [Candidatus Obscuribacterales bacterium]